jgi:hypothetical protein
MTICSLQSRTGYELALRKLNASGTLGVFHRWLRGPLRGIAEIYLPYRLYKVTLEDRRVRSLRYYAMDAAAGTLDPYEFVTLPKPEAWAEVQTRNLHPVKLEESETRKLTLEKVRRLLFSRGFFQLVNPQISAELVKPEFYIPYWAGFYGNDQNVRVTVMDGVRQTIEGSKVRQLVQAWLLGVSTETPACVPARQ